MSLFVLINTNKDYFQGCVNALNFNQKGNLLASGSDDLAVIIWDWARGKKQHWFESGHCSNMFQVCTILYRASHFTFLTLKYN